MRLFIRWRNLLFLIPTCFTLLFIYKIVIVERQSKCFLPSRLDTYCNNPLLPETGAEGKVSSIDYRLESLHIVTRHGDRSAIHDLYTKKHSTPSFRCMYQESLIMGIPILKDFIQSMKHNKAILDTPAFRAYSKMPLFPDLMVCPTGTLTPEGTAQLVRNGLFLQNRYREHDLYKDSMDIHVTTTTYTRTFQTAVAFLYGFMPHLNLSSVPFEQSPRPNMCSKHSPLKCHCPVTQGTDNILASTFQQNWNYQGQHEGEGVSLKERIQQVFQFEPHKGVVPPSPVFDFLLSHYCHQQQIVDDCLLASVFNHVNQLGRKMEKKKEYVSLSRLKMLPLLSEISGRMKQRVNKSFSPPIVRVYSGHDTTLEPLLAALGVGDGNWPKYASRFVIEHFSHRSSGKHFMRFLYDGKPVTHAFEGCYADVRFVDKYSLCPLERLFSWLQSKKKIYRLKCYKHQPAKPAHNMHKKGKSE